MVSADISTTRTLGILVSRLVDRSRCVKSMNTVIRIEIPSPAPQYLCLAVIGQDIQGEDCLGTLR